MSLRKRLLLIIATVMLLLAFALALLLTHEAAAEHSNAMWMRREAAQQTADEIAEQCLTRAGADIPRFYGLAVVAASGDGALERIVLVDLDRQILYAADRDQPGGYETKLADNLQLPTFGDVPDKATIQRLGYSFAVPAPQRATDGTRTALLARIRPPRLHDIEGTLFWIVMSILAGAAILIVSIYLATWRLVLRPVEQLALQVDTLAVEERASQARAAEVTGVSGSEAGQEAPLPGGKTSSQIELAQLEGELIKSRTTPPSAGNELQRLSGAFDRMARELREHRADLHAQIETVVAERAQAQARWIAAERLNATGRLAAGVAHEVNNPLGGIRNALRTIRTREQARPEPDARTLEYLNLMEDGLTRIGNITTDLLGFSRRNSRPEMVDLVETATASQRLLAHRFHDAKTEFDLQNETGGPVTILGERAKLGQIFLNLFGNSLDAILERNAAPETRKIRLRITREGAALVLRVRDTGAGMSIETQAQVTELFFTTKDPGKGTGLGLAVVATIVGDLDGQLHFESSPEGSTVIISLPVTAGASAPPASLPGSLPAAP